MERLGFSCEDIFSAGKRRKLPKNTALGIDIGSRQGKAVLIHKGYLYTDIEPTGLSMQETADRLKRHLLKRAGIEESDIDYLIGTGYGRVSLSFQGIENDMLTEISCHAKGAAYLADNVRTVLDIGGQDSKIIKVDGETGQVLDFAMNDKCAAGTGRFLERAAEILGYDLLQIGEESLKAEKIHEISSQCVVFAESEIVSARASGAEARDILAGVHASVIGRVKGLFQRIGIEKNVMFTGGVSNNAGMRKALEDMLGFPVVKPKLNPVFAGALGAAVYALEKSREKTISFYSNAKKEKKTGFSLDLSSLEKAMEEEKQAYIRHEGGKKNAAYLCAYTPLEILDAAGVRHIRMLHTGNEKEIAAGEAVVSKITCDYIKSFIGGFAGGNPLYRAVDKLYSFYTCSFMSAAARAVAADYLPAGMFAVPKLTDKKESVGFYVRELENFVLDLEAFTGEKISQEKIRESIGKYNRARKLLREISAYRKREIPFLKSMEYQKIALSYYYLPADRLLQELRKIKRQLESASKTPSGIQPLRLFLTGGILTEADQKVIKMIEEDFHAVVVVEDNCSGYTPIAFTISEDADPLTAIAEGYLGKSPCANMKPLDKRIRFTVELAKEYQADRGKKAAWIGQAGEAPLIYAANAIPASYIELCRFGTKKAASYVENDLQIPGDVCSMVKVMLGEFHYIGKEHISYIFANTGVCEPFNLAFGLLEKEGFPVYYQDAPAPTDLILPEKKFKELFSRRKESNQAIFRLLTGNDIDKERLREELVRYNRTLKKVNDINELRRNHKSYLKNLPASYIILGIGNYFGHPMEYEEILDEMTEELKALPEGAYNDELTPLVWSGARSVDFGICDSLDKAGGVLLDWNVPTGLHNFFDEDEDPEDALVHYGIGYNGRKKSASMGISVLDQMIREVKAKGVIFYNYMGCPMCAVNTFLMGRYVKELSLPYLSLDGSFPTEAPTGQFVTRVEAFLEMVS